jgi:CheY-like chemotaxis protein
MNLCINARDAMPNGGQLTLRAENVQLDQDAGQLHPDARPGAYLLLTVSDTGEGMTPEIIEKIFQPFFTTKELRGGTGLGLSTSLDIVKAHGGFVAVKSRPGEGSRFSVYLPALTTPLAEAETELSRLPSGNGEMILLVDDEVSICEITKAALENYGYRVLVANSGPEAVTLYSEKRNEVKLVITDTGMPFMDGNATSVALKEINPALKIIMASGGAPDKNAKELPANVDIAAFAPKPYTVEKLLTIVHEVLQRKT